MSCSIGDSYDFGKVIYLSRSLQLGISIVELLVMYSDSAALSTVAFLIYTVLIGLNVLHLAARWYYNIDGRYDLKQLVREPEMTAKVQYSIALFTPTVLGFVIWRAVDLTVGLPAQLFSLMALGQFLAASAQFGLEAYEVYLKN